MALCDRCGRREATKQRLSRSVCDSCAAVKLTREEWFSLAPSVALMALFLTGISVVLPYGTLVAVKLLLASIHG